jgi:hypothetical protein
MILNYQNSTMTKMALYNMSFTAGGLFIRESVELAELYLILGDWNIVRSKALADNLIQSRTSSSAIRVCREICQRLEGLHVAELKINLYDLSIEILKQEGDWDFYLESETTMSRQQLREDLQGILDASDVLIPAIAKKMAMHEYEVMFLSGVGEVFPYIRSHNILNNLQSAAKDKPTVIFFPGAYTHSLENGASLDLFGRLHDDKYYRAFNIFHCEI